MNKKGQVNQVRKALRIPVVLFILVLLFSTLQMNVFAETGKTEVEGKVYQFDKENHYEFSESDKSESTTDENTYGTFCISGNVTENGSMSGVPSYEVSQDGLNIFYNYEDEKLNADENNWHLVDDKSNKAANMKLDSDVMKGAIILQTSKDRKNWVTVSAICNLFHDTPIQTDSIYSATDMELINGCFYRAIVVYQLGICTDTGKILFVDTAHYDYKKFAEVYEFYAFTDNGDVDRNEEAQNYNLGEKVKSQKFDGYFGEKLIDQNDSHYGWEVGNFFVSGYSDKVTDKDGNAVFLKNVGDQVTLWFRLNQNINKLNENENLTITADTEGYDQYFETSKMNFGRGTLIIRYTDHNNVKSEPIIYTNYLEANTSVNADTKVQILEEGDYEVALDYEVTDNKLIDKVGHYRIFFKFAVRNGNCMFYPFDTVTGSELINNSITENGFRLDLAKSQYLKINIKRETLKDSADGLVEDTRFNGTAKQDIEYNDEGVYTITASNEYTGQTTTKKIYVGTNNVLRAHITTGLSIPEINDLVLNGATISDDGAIQLSSTQLTEEQEDKGSSSKFDTSANGKIPNQKNKKTLLQSLVFAGVFACIIIVIVVVVVKRKKKFIQSTVEQTENKGGSEQ